VRAVESDEPQITVMLVGGRRFREQCLARFLELSGVEIRTCSVENLREDLQHLNCRTDLALIDTGEHTCRDREIRTIFACLEDVLPSVPIVVVSDREDWLAVRDAMDSGVRAYFPSNLDEAVLLDTLQLVRKGATFVPLELLNKLPMQRKRPHREQVGPPDPHGLTPREEVVLELLKTGQSNKVIARELEIEEGTVKVHVRRIMRKLNAANRTQAALVAQEMARVRA
jgi:DNA-binding NarL/FixJ family response regulator